MARLRSAKRSRGFLVQKPLGQFTPRVQAVGPEHFGVICIDGAKARSKFCCCDFYGNVLIPPTVVEHTQTALHGAIDRIRATLRAHPIQDVVVAIERTGTYHRPVQDAFRRAGFETRLVHPYASTQFRQPADPGNKTDDTDLAGIFRAAVQGFGLIDPVWPDVYRELQQLSRQRRDLVAKTTTLRCQIKETMHQLMPGYVELFAYPFFDTPVALPLARATGSAAAIVEAGLDGLQQRAAGHRCKLTTLVRILDWARTAPPPQNPAPLFREQLDRLADDFLQKTREIRGLEQGQAHRLATTPFVRLLALPGICVVSAAELAGELGPISHYADAGRITGRAGLCPSRYQSDQVDRHGPLRRRAHRRLRAALLRIADNLIRHNHHYRALAGRWQRPAKDPRWVRVKVAKGCTRLAFVLLTVRGHLAHPSCQPRHSICDKLLAFHCDHQTAIAQSLADVEQANAQLSGRTQQEERQMLERQLNDPSCRRRRGPQALAQIIPLVLARLGIRVVQSTTEGEDPS